MTYVIQLNLKIVETFTQFKYFFSLERPWAPP